MSDAVPRRSSGKPWLIGCGVAAVVLLLCAGVVAFLGVRGWHLVQGALEQGREDEEFAQRWQPPADPDAEGTFAPESVAGYELTSADENAAFPALGIDREGSHAVYEKGNDTVEVSVYPTNEAETSAVFDEVVQRISDDRFKTRSHVRLPRSLRFSVSDPADLNGILWHAQGWLVFVHSETVSDLAPFLREYLTEVSKDAEDEPAEDGATEESGQSQPAQEPKAASEEEVTQ
jgi:hypothetical protein